MTGKELRELARKTLAKELNADKVDMDRVNAAGMTLNLPNDPDEEREAHRRHVEDLNALSMQNAANRPGTLMPPMGINSVGPAGQKWGR